MMFFSLSMPGFYPENKRSDYERNGNWPADAVNVSPEEEAVLRTALANGDRIIRDVNGWVIEPKPPEPLSDVKTRLAGAIDNEISDIYTRFTRFSDEYREREAAAHAFVAANYIGDAGPWVMGYALPSGKTAAQAADTIILQAAALKDALVTLGGLRMRKHEIKADAVANTEAAQAIHDDIIAKAKAAVVGL